MTEMNLVLTLALVTFGLVSLWAYQTKREAEEGMLRKQRVDNDNESRRR